MAEKQFEAGESWIEEEERMKEEEVIVPPVRSATQEERRQRLAQYKDLEMIDREMLYKLHQDLCDEALDLMRRKNVDYAQDVSPFANLVNSASAMGIHPGIGTMVRIMDKLSRVRSFIEAGALQVKDESVLDSIVDIVNYSVLLYGILAERMEGE